MGDAQVRADDVDFLIVPGWTDSGPDHWQTRWQTRLKNARRAPIADYDRPKAEEWVRAVADAAMAAERPTVVVAHSLGCIATARAALTPAAARIAGAMLVAPPDLDDQNAIAAFLQTAAPHVEAPQGFQPVPTARLPFPSLLVASRNDPFATFARSEALAAAWGSTLVDAGEAGHIHAAAGYGPWPEGAMRLAALLKSLP